MRILSYLEYENPYTDYQLKLNMLKVFGKQKSYDFYSQPFKPELITELFGGWTLGTMTDEDDKLYFVANSDKYRIEFSLETGSEFIFYGYDYTISKHDIIKGRTDLLPRTLDDFITDAARAGINLE